MRGYITRPENVSLFAVSPATSERVRPVVTLPEAAGLQIKAAAHASPLNTPGVLARGRTHDVLRFAEQASCFLLGETWGVWGGKQRLLSSIETVWDI